MQQPDGKIDINGIWAESSSSLHVFAHAGFDWHAKIDLSAYLPVKKTSAGPHAELGIVELHIDCVPPIDRCGVFSDLSDSGYRMSANGALALEAPSYRLVAIENSANQYSHRRFSVWLAWHDTAPPDPRDIHFALAYAAPSMLFHLTKNAPYHAAAVALDGYGAVMFVGHAGAGKSSLAGLLGQLSDWQILGDDIIIPKLPKNTEDQVKIHPAAAGIKLWHDMAKKLHGQNPQAESGFTSSRPADTKKAIWSLPHHATRIATDLPALDAIIELEWLYPASAKAELIKRDSMYALSTLQDACHNPELSAMLENEHLRFAQNALIAATTPFFTLRRPKNFAALEETAELVKQALAQ